MIINYCDPLELQADMHYALRRVEKNTIPSRDIVYIGVSKKTRFSHLIHGWVSITGEDAHGNMIPIRDIWTGFNYEKSHIVRERVQTACVALMKTYKVFI